MNTLSNSWKLAKASLQVLREDKELMIFPIISSIGLIIVTALFVIPMALADAFASGNEVLDLVILFLFYVVQYFVIFYANTALVGAALIRLRGGDPTVSDGLRIAGSRFLPILGYSLIAATVGIILKALSRRGGWLAEMATSLVGLAWNIATFLVVPVLAVENVGPIEAIKRSAAMLKKTWGEQIVGNWGIGALFGLIAVGGVVIGAALIGLAASYVDSVALIIALVVLLVLFLIAVALINATLNGIYTAAVYQYASDGVVGQFFEADMVQNAFRVQESRSLLK